MNMMTELAGVKQGGVLHAKMRIAGEHVGGDRVIEVRNPYTGAVVGTVPKATVEDIRARLRRSPAATRPSSRATSGRRSCTARRS